MEQFFSPNSRGHLRSDAYQSQIIGGDADVDHTKLLGGYSQIIRGDISLPGFGIPVCDTVRQRGREGTFNVQPIASLRANPLLILS